MNEVKLALRSRTFWTIVLLVLINVIPVVKTYVSSPVLDSLSTILGLIATAFHVNPSQKLWPSVHDTE